MAALAGGRPAFAVPVLRDLVTFIQPTHLDEPVAAVLERFGSQQTLLALPVLDEAGFHLLARRTLLNYFSRAYAKELFIRKTLRDLLAHAPQLGYVPFCPAADSRVDQVLRDLLEHDPELMLEAVPVQAQGRILGVVPVADLMLSISESQARLIDTLQVLSRRLQSEVANAALLQRTLLPPPEMRMAGLAGQAHMITSSEVGGDYYDYFAAGPHRTVLLVGDVSGHGVASGTMVSAAKAGVNLLATEGVSDPREILERLNQTLLATARQSLLMTLFCASVDTRNGTLRFANAGHQFPYLRRAGHGTWSMLEAGGLPLGKEAKADYASQIVDFEVGDRLFLYTDGVVEAESPVGEPFGYERLEALLDAHGAAPAAQLKAAVLDALHVHCGGDSFADDVTLFVLDFQERPEAVPGPVPQSPQPGSDLIRIADAFYRVNPAPISPRIARQSMVFLAESCFADLLPRLCRDGIRRVLPRRQAFLQQLGWEELLLQHREPSDGADDLHRLLPATRERRAFDLTGSEDKSFIMSEAEAWLAERGALTAEHLETVVLLLDEMLENGLYAAPRDGQGRPLYSKGMRRTLAATESLRLELALGGQCLGIAVSDDWGTLTPATFLNRLVRHLAGQGLEAGVGGAGLYLIWRLADYLQIRVHPQRRTQITALLDLASPLDAEADTGFQFLYHSEVNEVPSHA
ncbi:MAG: SpoIIE family protein phosphatase [Pseudomonadota bacterium]|uniref:SpoIIE family protein phosphatase n=1 Tax=Thermithiobacillus tepidarius TaxID=929 RepID=UPI0006862709|nr:SpoIIE family protein phosphatase [Thermithiobacillus tepidarius]